MFAYYFDYFKGMIFRDKFYTNKFLFYRVVYQCAVVAQDRIIEP